MRDDVLIVGAGAVGLATAVALARSGRSVRVLERGEVGGATSHGNCGTLTPSHAPPLAAPGVLLQALRWSLDPASPLYVRPGLDLARWGWLARFARRCNAPAWRQATAARAALLNDSRQRLPGWMADFGLDCEFRTDGLDYVFRNARHFDHHRAQCAALAQLGIATEVKDGQDYLRDEPAFRDGLVGAIHFPGDASLRPERYTAELARVARGLGVVIEEDCALTGIAPDAQGVSVQTTAGPRRATELVLAGGPWTPALARGLDITVPITAGKGYSITTSRPALVPRCPVVLKDHSVFVIGWEQGLRLGGTMEFSGFDTRLNTTRLAAIERAAALYLHQPQGDVVQERWWGWRPMSPDDVPLLGRSPSQPHVWLAAGHGMLGISMSCGTGQLMADLVTGAETSIDPRPYRPERFA